MADFSGIGKLSPGATCNLAKSGDSMRKDIRHCRDFMRSAAEECSAGDWVNSVQKLGFLPEAQNDMIFSIVCEELGLVGAGIIIVLFLILIWRFFVIATHAPDLFGALIAAGAMAHMMIQVILNIAVVTNSIPNTGITLPFISYGGTSVVFLLLEMGLVLSISRLVQ